MSCMPIDTQTLFKKNAQLLLELRLYAVHRNFQNVTVCCALGDYASFLRFLKQCTAWN